MKDNTKKSYGKRETTYKGKNKKSNARYGRNSCGNTENVKSSDETTYKARNTEPWDAITSNDISWWNKSVLYKDAVRVPFNRISGDPINLHATNAVPTIKTAGVINFPGILAIDFIPMLGTTSNSNSPANRAFTSLYAKIYSKTTGAMQFTQASLAMFATSFASIGSLIAAAKRVLELPLLWSGKNYYYPRDVIRACGFNPATIIGHQDEVRRRLNNIILSYNALAIPNFMTIFARQYSLARNIYADSDDVMAQLTVFRPRCYYKYVDAAETGSHCECTPVFTGEEMDINVYLDKIEEGLEIWRHSSDLGLISGSIQRAFSESELIHIDYAEADKPRLPVVDRNINWQIHNCITMDVPYDTCNITEDVVKDVIIQAPQLRAATTPVAIGHNYLLTKFKNFILDSLDGVTDDEFIMEGTRLLSYAEEDGTIKHWNTEIPTGMTMYVRRRQNDGSTTLQHFSFSNGYGADGTEPNFTAMLEIIAPLSQWANAPLLYAISHAGGSISDVKFIGNVNKYTTIDRESLNGLNEAALQSVYSTDTGIDI